MAKKTERLYLVKTYDEPVSEEFRFLVAINDKKPFDRPNISDFHSGKYCRDEWEVGRYISEQEQKRLALNETK